MLFHPGAGHSTAPNAGLQRFVPGAAVRQDRFDLRERRTLAAERTDL